MPTLLATLSIAVVMLAALPVRGQNARVPVPTERVTIDDAFWSPKIATWRKTTINDALDKFERDGTVENFQRVADGQTGGHQQAPWFDGLLYETITGASGFLKNERDEQLEARIDGYVDVIDAASKKGGDGYLHTFVTLERPNQRWGKNGGMLRFQHDIYNQGCLIEAGAAYYKATGKTKLLEVALRSANHQDEAIGPKSEQPMVPGHAVSERALVELWQLFQDEPELAEKLDAPVHAEDYLALAKAFIDYRGNHEGREALGAYAQDETPVLERPTMVIKGGQRVGD